MKNVRPASKTAKNRAYLERSYKDSAQVCTKSGFPVMVWMNIQPADCSVGINRAYIDEFAISTLNGCGVPWLKLTTKEEEALAQLAYENISTWEY